MYGCMIHCQVFRIGICEGLLCLRSVQISVSLLKYHLLSSLCTVHIESTCCCCCCPPPPINPALKLHAPSLAVFQVDVRALKDLLWDSLVTVNQQKAADTESSDAVASHATAAEGAAVVPFEEVRGTVRVSGAGDCVYRNCGSLQHDCFT